MGREETIFLEDSLNFPSNIDQKTENFRRLSAPPPMVGTLLEILSNCLLYKIYAIHISSQKTDKAICVLRNNFLS